MGAKGPRVESEIQPTPYDMLYTGELQLSFRWNLGKSFESSSKDLFNKFVQRYVYLGT